ncbi:MAG: DUF721 domain-containing protein [Marinilabiliales bacterium]|nr:MAG: DUF721 domain-containing protein [Marinilabiliales bacterium]
MRRNNTQSIGEVLKEYIKAMKLSSGLQNARITSSWEEVVGKTVARYTSKLYIKDHKLFVHLSSSVVKNELLMIRGEILKRLNDIAGEEVINEIILC